MAWTYSGDPGSSNRDAVRFLIQDTDTNDQLLQDAEIDWLLSETSTVYGAATEAAKAIATYFARLADTDIESVSVKYSQKHKQYLKIANRLQIKADASGSGIAKPDVNGVSVSEMESVWEDDDRPNDRFYRGQFDNPPNFHGEDDSEWH
jgi:hypothetical protein